MGSGSACTERTGTSRSCTRQPLIKQGALCCATRLTVRIPGGVPPNLFCDLGIPKKSVRPGAGSLRRAGPSADSGCMTTNRTSSANSKWTGMVPVDDTALDVTDTGGPGIPLVYLNGQFATPGYWRRVIADLGTGWRHITYDERARGKSKRSADYSFEVAVRDVDAVLEARGVHRPLLVGWSYGAVVARTGPAGIRTVPWARCWLTARTRTTGLTRPRSSGSGSCSGGWAGSCRCCARRAWPRG